MTQRIRWRAALGTLLAISLTGCGDRQAPDPAAAIVGVYKASPPSDRMALRLAHLKGYFLIAAQQAEPVAAAGLASQGMLEVYDAQPGAFRDVDLSESTLRTAAAHGTPDGLRAALTALGAAQAQAGGDQRAVVRSMVRLADGLYGGVSNGGGVDALEYQHSLGAALAARDLAASSADARLSKAKADLDHWVALWPGPVPPATPVPAATVDAMTVRIIADLS